jgi:hypothetical protein
VTLASVSPETQAVARGRRSRSAQGSGSYEILEGERVLRLEAPGFAPLERTLAVTAGEAQDLGVLELTPARGVLSLSSDPGGANVSLDGEFAGQTPLELELEPGIETIASRLSRAGYRRAAATTVSMQAGAVAASAA